MQGHLRGHVLLGTLLGQLFLLLHFCAHGRLGSRRLVQLFLQLYNLRLLCCPFLRVRSTEALAQGFQLRTKSFASLCRLRSQTGGARLLRRVQLLLRLAQLVVAALGTGLRLQQRRGSVADAGLGLSCLAAVRVDGALQRAVCLLQLLCAPLCLAQVIC